MCSRFIKSRIFRSGLHLLGVVALVISLSFGSSTVTNHYAYACPANFADSTTNTTTFTFRGCQNWNGAVTIEGLPGIGTQIQATDQNGTNSITYVNAFGQFSLDVSQFTPGEQVTITVTPPTDLGSFSYDASSEVIPTYQINTTVGTWPTSFQFSISNGWTTNW